MKIKKGDKVVVVSGKDKGTSGVVTHVLPLDEKVIVEGVNIRKKHQRPRRTGEKGSIVEKAMPIAASNVMVVDPKTGKPTRVKIVRKDGVRTRVAQKSGETL